MKHTEILIGTFVLALAMSLFAAGCGGGSSSSTTATTGTLSGTSTDNNANPLDQYVQVTIAPSGDGTPTIVQTDASGAYTASLPAGDYSLTANRPGYENYSSGTLTVTAGLTTTHDISMSALAENVYIGSGNCSVCHDAIYATYVETGHNFKLNKVVNGTVPTYPFSTIEGALAQVDDDDGITDNPLGTPASYDNVSYVIGGFGWKARWIDLDGHIVTGTKVQYNIEDASFSAYHDNEVRTYNCGNCHTTGWKHFDAVLNDNRQDNLPGMDGTFDQTGIQCESCHGAGSTHAQTLLAADITKVATARTTADFLAADMAYGKAVACSECHTRDGEKDYPSFVSAYETASGLSDQEGGRIDASGSLIRHHEQYDELLGVNPDNTALGSTRTAGFQAVKFGCTTCHNTHTTTKWQDVSGDAPGAAGTNADCLACHPGNAITSGGMTGLNCIDCHMPYLVKSAINTFQYTGSDGVTTRKLGDIRSHVFKIDLTATEQFTDGGAGFAYPWITGEYACRSCHSPEGVSFPITDFSGFTIHQ